jgi:glucose dehydrogenase
MQTPIRSASALWLAAVICAAPLIAQELALPQITYQDLLDGFKNPTRRLTYSGDYPGRRHSSLNQITPEDVHLLSAQWTFQAEAMPPGRRARWSQRGGSRAGNSSSRRSRRPA